MVVAQATPRKFEFLRNLHRVRVVLAEHPRTVLIMKGQAVSDPMGNMLRRLHRLHIDLDPETILLFQDAAIQFKEGLETNIAVNSHSRQYIIR